MAIDPEKFRNFTDQLSDIAEAAPSTPGSIVTNNMSVTRVFMRGHLATPERACWWAQTR